MLRIFIWILVLGAVALALSIGWLRMSAYGREDLDAATLLGEGRFVSTRHGDVHLIEKGPEDGAAILIVHGPFDWSGLWVQTLDYLSANGFRAMAIDMPPMGLSQRDPRGDYSRQAQALRLLAFLEAENVEPIVIVHSFGAGPVFEAALAQPQTMRGIVAVSAFLGLDQDEQNTTLPWYLSTARVREAVVAATMTNPFLQPWLYRQLFHRESVVTDELVENLSYPFSQRGTTEALARWLPDFMLPAQGARSADVDALSALERPVVLIWGQDDTITVPSRAVRLGNALNDAPVFWLENSGHMPHLEQPEAFHDTLLNALGVVAATQ